MHACLFACVRAYSDVCCVRTLLLLAHHSEILFLHTAATAFVPGAVLPSSSGLRLAGQQGPVCFLAEGAAKSEPLTVLNGRGDKRSVKGKRFAKSFGKCRPKKGNREVSFPSYRE